MPHADDNGPMLKHIRSVRVFVRAFQAEDVYPIRNLGGTLAPCSQPAAADFLKWLRVAEKVRPAEERQLRPSAS